MTETRIRWSDDGTEGYVGTVGQRIFTLYPPQDGGEWMMAAALPGFNGRIKYRDTLEELHPDAEQWLSEFVSSLGAVFPADAAADLRSYAAEMEGFADGGEAGRHDRSMFATGMRRAADLIEHGDIPAVAEPAKETGQ